MPNLVIDGKGTERSLDQLQVAFEEFKEIQKPKSRLDLRKQKDLDTTRGYGIFYEFIRSFSDLGEKVPKRGSRQYDEYLDEIWKKEPILAGTVYGMVAKAQSKQWKVSGGKTNATRAARMLDNALFSYWKHGWAGFAGVSSLDFHTCPRGAFWGLNRRGNNELSQVESIEHLDAHACSYTESYTKPVLYESPATGQTIEYAQGEILNLTSMTLSREREKGAGYCAVERAMSAAQILIALHEYEAEKLSNLPPEGIAAISGLTMEEFTDAIALWKAQRIMDDSLIYPQVLFLLAQLPGANVGVDLTTFSSMPESITRETVVIQYVNVLANCFGISASDIWFMGGGPFGVGKEAELQHTYAKGKGEGEWFSATEQAINREMPPDTTFSYDTSDIEEDMIAATSAKAWVDTLLPIITQVQAIQLTPDQWQAIFIEKGILPTWVKDGTREERIVVSASDVYKEGIDDAVTFLWSMGRIREERPTIALKDRVLDTPSGRMIGIPMRHASIDVPLPPAGADAVAQEDWHITLAFFPDPLTSEQEARLLEALMEFGKQEDPFSFTLNGYGTFETDHEKPGKVPLFASVGNDDDLRDFRARLVAVLDKWGIPYDRKFPVWTPHMTLAYVPKISTVPTFEGPPQIVHAWEFVFAHGERSEHISLSKDREKEAVFADIRGVPIPEAESEVGTAITKKTRLAEMAVWGDIPELQRFLPEEPK